MPVSDVPLSDPLHLVTLDQLVAPAQRGDANRTVGLSQIDLIVPGGRYLRPRPHTIVAAYLDADQRPSAEGNYSQFEQEYRPIYRLTLQAALLVGQGGVVTRDNGLLVDSVLEFLAHDQIPTGFATDNDGMLFAPVPTRRIEGPALLVKRPWWPNYGHWLIDGAALLALLSQRDMPQGWQIIIGRNENPQMRQVVADTLRQFAPGVPVLEHADDEVWAVDTLLYLTPVHVPPLCKHPEGLARLRAGILLDALGQKRPDRRLFIIRADEYARRLENAGDLLRIALAKGYEPVQPQLLSLHEQAALFHSAASVVGVKGAALSNLLFCQNGAQCLVLSPGDFPDPFFWDLAGHARVQYSEIFGRLTERARPRGQNGFVIDRNLFQQYLP